jgi:hypothetical protein|tara:strand:+ start:108 stop:287 length:180 start_codon:yes stop_codon:yes gene_type:complete
MRAKLDQILNKYLSRKLMVFFIASAGLFSGQLLSGDWVILATVYIGTQGAVDIVQKLRK